MIHILRECKATKNEMTIEEFIREKGKILILMKEIGKLREQASFAFREKSRKNVEPRFTLHQETR